MYQVRSDLFDWFSLPEGVQKGVLITELLGEIGELESLYTDPDVLKSLIGAWSDHRLYTWTELYKTTQYEYNPIWNKDGTITETEERTLGVVGNEKKDIKSDASTNSESTADGTSLHEVYGYNSSNAEPADKDTTHSEAETDVTSTDKTTSNADTTRDEDEKIVRTREEHGNIGVTSTQSMIREQRDVVQFDIYDFIIQDFKGRFCLLVY